MIRTRREITNGVDKLTDLQQRCNFEELHSFVCWTSAARGCPTPTRQVTTPLLSSGRGISLNRMPVRQSIFPYAAHGETPLRAWSEHGRTRARTDDCVHHGDVVRDCDGATACDGDGDCTAASSLAGYGVEPGALWCA